MNILKNKRGGIKIGTVIFVAALAALIFFVIAWYPAFKVYYRIKEIAHETGNKAVHERDSEMLRNYLAAKAERAGASEGAKVYPRDVQVRISDMDNKVYISIGFHIPVKYPFMEPIDQVITMDYNTDLTPLDWNELKKETKF